MSFLQIISIVVIAWIAFSALVVAIAAAAGRADARERRSATATTPIRPTAGGLRQRARLARRAYRVADRAADERRTVPTGVGAVIR